MCSVCVQLFQGGLLSRGRYELIPNKFFNYEFLKKKILSHKYQRMKTNTSHRCNADLGQESNIDLGQSPGPNTDTKQIQDRVLVQTQTQGTVDIHVGEGPGPSTDTRQIQDRPGKTGSWSGHSYRIDLVQINFSSNSQ